MSPFLDTVREEYSGVTNAEARKLFEEKHGFPGWARRKIYGDQRAPVIVTGHPPRPKVTRPKISRKPEDVDLQVAERGFGTSRYYDGNRYRNQDEALKRGRWYVAVVDRADFETGEELDVQARDKREASLIVKAALARDYDPKLNKIRRLFLA